MPAIEQTRINIPNRVWLTLTGMCNNQCVWCFRRGSESNKFLDLNLIRSATKTLVNCGTRFCTLTGGEPTLHPQFELIIKELTADGMFSSCIVITNARKFAYSVPDEIAKNKRVHVTASIHGADSQHYQSNTGVPEGFYQAVTGIKNLVAAGIRCSASIVLGPENLGRIEDFISLTARLGIETLCFTIGIPSLDNPTYNTNPLAVANAIPAIASLCENVGQKYCFVLSLPWCLLEKEFLEKMFKSEKIMFNCPVPGGNSIVIKENGAIALCTHTTGYELASPEEAKVVLSNPESFRNFWGSQTIRNLRATIDVFRHNRCLSCQYRWWCRGGCPLWWQFYDFSEVISQRS